MTSVGRLKMLFCCLETLQQLVCPRVRPITTGLHAALCSTLLSLPQLSVFVLKGGLLSLKAVIGRKSCLATTWRDAKRLFTLHPLTSCAHCPFSPSLSLFLWRRDGVAWGGGRQCGLLLSDEFRQQILKGRREGEER